MKNKNDSERCSVYTDCYAIKVKSLVCIYNTKLIKKPKNVYN